MSSTGPSPTGSNGNGNGMIGDMRERLATLEANHRMSADRMNSTDSRLTEGDRRMNGMAGRLQAVEIESKTHSGTAAEIKALADRLQAFELRRAANLAWLQYGAAALIFALTASGKLDPDKAIGFLLKLAGHG